MKPKNKLTKYQILAEPEFGKAKRINTWINGETHCFTVSINPKDFRSWPPILAHISNIIQPSFGMIKKLMALSTMQSVHSFDDLDPKEKYIAMGAQCKFRVPPGGYGSPTADSKKTSNKSNVKKLFYVGDLNPKSIPFLQGMAKKKLTVVYVAVSGKTRPPQKVIFNEHDMKDWNLIRNYLAKILGITEGVQHICTIYGDILDDANQFQHGYLYVAVPFTQSFIQMDYVKLSEEKSIYRKNFMPPVQPAFNMNSFARAPGLDKRSIIADTIPSDINYCYENEKLRPKKDFVTEERQKVFQPNIAPNSDPTSSKDVEGNLKSDKESAKSENIEPPTSKSSTNNTLKVKSSEEGKTKNLNPENAEKLIIPQGPLKQQIQAITLTSPVSSKQQNETVVSTPPVPLKDQNQTIVSAE